MIERHILPYFENKSMNEITPADIIQWQNKMREAGYSQTYLRMLQNQMTARVTEKNFGVGYTKEAIRDRIEKRVKAQEKFPVKKKIPFPKRPDAKRALIDTDQEKFQENGALKHWADIQNLKIAAASYAEGGSVEELKQKILERNATAKEARSAVGLFQKTPRNRQIKGLRLKNI